MKKYLLILFAALLNFTSVAQPYNTVYNYGNAFQRVSVYSSLIIPYKDTGTLLTDSTRAGGLTIRPADNKLYLFNGTAWALVGCCANSNVGGIGIIIAGDTIKVDTTVIADKKASNVFTGVQTFSVPIIFSSSTTAGGSLYTTSLGVVTSTAAGASTTVLHGGVTPSWSQVSLTGDITGVLPYANGGTNANTSWTQGSLLFAGASSLSQDNAFLSYDASGHILQLGTAGSSQGKMKMSGATSGVITFTTSAAAGTYTWSYPNTAGTTGQVLQTDGSGNLSWANQSGGGGVSSVSIASANGFAGSSSGGTTPALTMSVTVTSGSIIKATTGGAITAAVAGTDYLTPSGAATLYVPYTGATTNVDLGSRTLTATTLIGTTANINTPTSTTGALNLNGQLLAVSNSATPISLSNALADFEASANSYTQVNIRNASNGASASSDFVATADNGSDILHYIDMGVNSSGYSVGTWTINGADDGYLYEQSDNLAIGTAANKKLSFFTGGTLAANERMSISGTGLITIADANDIALGTTTGTKFGTATSQKLAFFNSTPIVQPSGNIFTALTNLGLVASPSLSTANLPAGVAYTANTLAQFTTTTSAGFFAVISDETGGGGVVVGSASPAFTGTPTAPTASVLNNSTQIATTAYVDVNLPQVTTTASYTTSVAVTSTAANINSTVHYNITAQAGALLFAAPTGSWIDGQILEIRIKDNGTSRALTYNGAFRAGTTVGAMPSSTTISKELYMQFQYNSNGGTFWDFIGYANGY